MRIIKLLVKHFGIGVALIVAAATLLLVSDPKWNREPKQIDAPKKVAIVNYASVPVLEDGEAGLLAGLEEAGYIDGENLAITYYNAEGDRSTAIMIAKEVTGADYEMVLTLSTPVMQAVAGANTTNQATHVFTLTTDPWGSGIGVSREDPSQHPPYMTGQGTLQPVAEVFKLAREANPDLDKVGVIWNPAESNSEASTLMARKICEELNIELIEVTVDNSSAVLEATKAAIARDIDAIWAGGDSTVAAALDAMIATAKDNGIPVFTNMPGDVKQGVMFSLGADYFEVGRNSGLLAARILDGENPADIPVENVVPKQLALNLVTQKLFQDKWTFSAEWKKNAKLIVDESGIHEEERVVRVSEKKPQAGRTYHVSIMNFAPNDVADHAIEALKRRMSELGFVEGQNLKIQRDHAQGDIGLIPQVLQKLDQSETDLIVTLSTPCLTAATTTIKNKPVVFTLVYDPIAAGAGTSADDHIPFITGVGSFPPLAEMIDSMQALVPGLKRVGIVYNTAEANSRKAIEISRRLFSERGLTLEEASVNNTNEILQAAQVLIQRDVQVLWEFGDNTVNQGLEALIKAANDANIPVVSSDADSSNRGSTAGVGISFDESGYAAGDLVADVLLGAKPSTIPFEEIAIVRRGLNFSAAKSLNLKFSDQLLSQSDVFHGVGTRKNRPAKIAFVQLVEGPTLDEAREGVYSGLKNAGLIAGKDIEIKTYNAQGDLSQLPQIFQSLLATEPDLIITSTTPAMIAAANATDSVPIVFTVASQPSAVGLFPVDQPQSNLTGVFDNPPIGKLLDLAEKQEGTIKTVGTIWNPAEPNSEISVKRLRKVCQERQYQLIERNAASVNELREVSSAMTQTGVDLVIISADNVTSAGFPAIYSVLQPEGIPIYCTEPDLVSQGAAGAVGVSFHDWGRQTALLAARVLAGLKPSAVPMEEVKAIRTLTQQN